MEGEVGAEVEVKVEVEVEVEEVRGRGGKSKCRMGERREITTDERRWTQMEEPDSPESRIQRPEFRMADRRENRR